MGGEWVDLVILVVGLGAAMVFGFMAGNDYGWRRRVRWECARREARRGVR